MKKNCSILLNIPVIKSNKKGGFLLAARGSTWNGRLIHNRNGEGVCNIMYSDGM
jgi:hypothetical protein